MTPNGLLLELNTAITCPKCAHDFPLAEGFARKALESVESTSSDALARIREEERNRQQREAERVAKERDEAHARALAEMRTIEEEGFRSQLEALRSQLADSKTLNQKIQKQEAEIAAREKSLDSRVAEAAAAKAAEIIAGERQEYSKRLADQGAQLQVLQAEQLSLRQERQKLQDEKAAMALEVQKQVDARVAERDATVRAQEQDKAALDKAELLKTIADMRTQLVEAQRKADQGSQQMQGEVLELAIEDSLRRSFPLDTIEEVKKGQRGGDIMQRVVNRAGQEAGAILWETKRAKDWSPQWIPKLKEDMRAGGATVGILVTMPGALPKDWASGALFAIYEDVWVTQVSTAVGVAEALRSGLLDVHRQRGISAGKGEKMEALYDYLTSPQFAQKLKAVYDTFGKMREELESERNATMQRWARREKQLQAGVAQLVGIGGEIQGLAQQELPLLEMEAGHERDSPNI